MLFTRGTRLARPLLIAGHPAGSARAVTVRTSVAATASGAKPTIVLVHGAWADSGSWNKVTLLLQQAGYTVYAPPNAADGNSNVKALVYDDAYLPAQGEDLMDLTTAGSCFYLPPAEQSTVFSPVTTPGAPSGTDVYVRQSVFPGCFANGLPASDGAVLAATQRPLATNALTDPSGVPAWKTIPSWAIIGMNDRVVTPAEQLFMAHRAGSRITEVNAPHLSMISSPGVVASVIIQAARATG
jgi:pimeloyl-ACP methyl ester carboxylesterase